MKKLVAAVALAILIPAASQAQNGQVVGPNGTVVTGAAGNWTPDVKPNAFAQVTGANPRLGFGGYGDGSLELSVTGVRDPVTGQYPDWGFYYRYSETPGGFGDLANLNRLSFDWYRQADANSLATNPSIDWPYKTPVVRLVLQDKNDQISELIWEGYYNRAPGEALNGAVTPLNQWNTTSGMQGGNFWFNRPPTQSGQDNIYVGTACENNTFTFWQGGIPGTALGQLLGSGGCLAGSEAKIIGIGVGVGSQWPLPYHAFVDNIQMGFAGSEALALNTNFDMVSTVPEPSTYALMGAGLLALGGISARRRRKALSISNEIA